jgi:hypothetical protein
MPTKAVNRMSNIVPRREARAGNPQSPNRNPTNAQDNRASNSNRQWSDTRGIEKNPMPTADEACARMLSVPHQTFFNATLPAGLPP